MSTVESLGATRSIRLRACAERGALPDEGAARVGGRQAALEETRALLEGAPLERPLDAHLELVERARLGDVVEGAHPDRLDGRVDRAVAGEHDDLAPGLLSRMAFSTSRPSMSGSCRSSSTTCGLEPRRRAGRPPRPSPPPRPRSRGARARRPSPGGRSRRRRRGAAIGTRLHGMTRSGRGAARRRAAPPRTWTRSRACSGPGCRRPSGGRSRATGTARARSLPAGR